MSYKVATVRGRVDEDDATARYCTAGLGRVVNAPRFCGLGRL